MSFDDDSERFSRKPPPTVLFVSAHNTGRSQMAAGLPRRATTT